MKVLLDGIMAPTDSKFLTELSEYLGEGCLKCYAFKCVNEKTSQIDTIEVEPTEDFSFYKIYSNMPWIFFDMQRKNQDIIKLIEKYINNGTFEEDDFIIVDIPDGMYTEFTYDSKHDKDILYISETPIIKIEGKNWRD